ncbi:MAG: prepilin peptidase [Candidatus Anammoxibacter sp.]
MNTIIFTYSLILGPIIGSFLNVCIYRIPKHKSIVFPCSFCTDCQGKIAWYDNFPIFSYIILAGKCRHCKASISARYIIVEICSALVTSGLIYLFIIRGDYSLPVAICYLILIYALIVVTFIDLEYMIIPNVITFPGMVVVLILSVIFPDIHNGKNDEIYSLLNIDGRLNSLVACIIGMLVSGGVILFAASAGRFFFRRESMGAGDVKLMCMVGGIIGWKLGLIIFFIAPFFGLFMAIPLKIIKKTKVIPYAPFLSLATVLVIFLGDYFINIVNIYISFIMHR